MKHDLARTQETLAREIRYRIKDRQCSEEIERTMTSSGTVLADSLKTGDTESRRPYAQSEELIHGTGVQHTASG
jgi:hypothetical protein